MVAPAAEAVQVPAAAGAGQRARSIKSDFNRLVAIVLGCSGCPFFFSFSLSSNMLIHNPANLIVFICQATSKSSALST